MYCALRMSLDSVSAVFCSLSALYPLPFVFWAAASSSWNCASTSFFASLKSFCADFLSSCRGFEVALRVLQVLVVAARLGLGDRLVGAGDVLVGAVDVALRVVELGERRAVVELGLVVAVHEPGHEEQHPPVDDEHDGEVEQQRHTPGAWLGESHSVRERDGGFAHGAPRGRLLPVAGPGLGRRLRRRRHQAAPAGELHL